MEFFIAPEEKKILLKEAREAIIARLDGRKPSYPQQKEFDANSCLNQPCGAFVTLHMVNGKERKLRGCIGRMTASLALLETVRLMACEAAFEDPRFPSLKKEELSQCCIEISALSPMTPCPDPQQVKVGIHGLYLRKDGRSGVLLPQVPVEQGWDLNQYLDYICIKAGLPPGAYKAPGAELSTFTAVVFGEE
jgi:AmmeMemoRadiSam system protein A